MLTVVAPAIPDATLADIALTLIGALDLREHGTGFGEDAQCLCAGAMNGVSKSTDGWLRSANSRRLWGRHAIVDSPSSGSDPALTWDGTRWFESGTAVKVR